MTDEERLDWLEFSPERMVSVKWRMENEDRDIRQAIDDLAVYDPMSEKVRKKGKRKMALFIVGTFIGLVIGVIIGVIATNIAITNHIGRHFGW